MIIGNYYLDSSETEEHSPNIVYLDAGNDVCGEQISLFHYENITKTEKKKRKKSLQDLAKEHQRVPSEENFMVIYKLIYPKILKTVQSYFYSSLKNKHTEEDIQDCCSNVIYRIWEFFYQYDSNKAKFSTWFYTIAKNEILFFIQKNKKHLNTERYSSISTNKNEHNEDSFNWELS